MSGLTVITPNQFSHGKRARVAEKKQKTKINGFKNPSGEDFLDTHLMLKKLSAPENNFQKGPMHTHILHGLQASMTKTTKNKSLYHL